LPGGVVGPREKVALAKNLPTGQEEEDTKKKKKGGKGGNEGVRETKGALKMPVDGARNMPEMMLDMSTEGSMEEREAHYAKIHASMRTEDNFFYLVELPEGFGKVLHPLAETVW
jgi:hypothetical protein